MANVHDNASDNPYATPQNEMPIGIGEQLSSVVEILFKVIIIIVLTPVALFAVGLAVIVLSELIWSLFLRRI